MSQRTVKIHQLTLKIALIHGGFEIVGQGVQKLECVEIIGTGNTEKWGISRKLALKTSTYALASPFLVQMAKSLVILPDSIVVMQTFSRAVQNFSKSGLLSILARWAKPRVHAKMEAKTSLKRVGVF